MNSNSRQMSALCMLTMLLSAMVMTAPSLMLPVLSSKFTVGISTSGSLFTASFLGYSVFALPGGALADRFGKKAMLVVSMAGLAATAALIPLAPGFALLVAVIFLYGGFTGVIQVMANSLQADLHRDRPAYFININGVFFGAGAILMPLISSAFVSHANGCLYLFLALSALSLLLGGCIALTMKQVESARMGLRAADVKQLTASKRLWLVCACLFLYTGVEVSTWGWMSTFLKEKLEFSMALSGVAASVFWAAMTLGRYLSGRLSTRFRIPALVIFLSASSFASVILCGLTSSAAFYWVIIAWTGLSFSGISPLLLAFGAERDLPPSLRTAAYATLMAVGNLGIAAIPWLTGIVCDKAGIQAAMAGPSVLFLIIIPIVLFVGRTDRRIHDSYEGIPLE